MTLAKRSSKFSDNASESLVQPATDLSLSRRMLQLFGGHGASDSSIAEPVVEQAEEHQAELKGLDALPISELGTWELTIGDLTAQRNLRHDQIFGYDSLLPHWTYEIFLAHVVPEDRPMIEEAFAEILSTKRHWVLECRIRRADGEERWIRSEADIQQNEYGQGVRICGLVGDITDQKQAEAEKSPESL